MVKLFPLFPTVAVIRTQVLKLSSARESCNVPLQVVSEELVVTLPTVTARLKVALMVALSATADTLSAGDVGVTAASASAMSVLKVTGVESRARLTPAASRAEVLTRPRYVVE